MRRPGWRPLCPGPRTVARGPRRRRSRWKPCRRAVRASEGAGAADADQAAALHPRAGEGDGCGDFPAAGHRAARDTGTAGRRGLRVNLVDITVHATGAQAKAAIDEVKGKLDDLGKRVADARIRLSGKVEAQAQLARINARMIELNNRVADPKIKLEGIARAQAELLALLAAMNKLDNTSTKRFSFGQGATGVFGAIQKGLAAILNLGPAAVPVLAGIAAAIFVIVSALGAMVSAIAAAGIGLGAFAVFAV